MSERCTSYSWEKRKAKSWLGIEVTEHECVLVGCNVYVMGGTMTYTTMSENQVLCKYNYVENTWTDHDMKRPNLCLTSCLINDFVWVFSTAEPGTLFFLDLLYNEITKTTTSGDLPPMATEFSLKASQYIEEINSLIVFDLAKAKTNGMDSVRVLDLNCKKWRVVSCCGTVPIAPLYNVSTCNGHGKIYVTGGHEESKCFDELLILTRNFVWSKVKMSGSVPVWRSMCSFTYGSGSLFVYGGVDQSGDSLNSIGIFNLKGGRWDDGVEVIGEGDKTHDHSSTYIDQFGLLVIGGYNRKQSNVLLLKCN